MAATLHREENRRRIVLDGSPSLRDAASLKDMLLQCLGEGIPIHLDLENLKEIDVSAMQLLWVAAREAECKGLPVIGKASAAALASFGDAGFADLSHLFRGCGA